MILWQAAMTGTFAAGCDQNEVLDLVAGLFRPTRRWASNPLVLLISKHGVQFKFGFVTCL
jgi:hypothetical protein